MTHALLSDVRGGKTLYATAGTKVTVISVSEPEVIVQANNIRFTTTINNLKDYDQRATN